MRTTTCAVWTRSVWRALAPRPSLAARRAAPALPAPHVLPAPRVPPRFRTRRAQGPINYRWKHGANKWRWGRELHPVRDATGSRLCGLVNGTAVGGVLPSAQFTNMLTFSVLQLGRAAGVAPYAVHATWMRQQREPFKLMRLREEMLWRDHPSWYGLAPLDTSPLSAATRAASNGYVAFHFRLPSGLLARDSLGGKDGVPVRHLQLMHDQLRQLRNALFVSRALGRALVLPRATCTCEMGFFPQHLQPATCRANDHPGIRLPANCSIDHYLDPMSLDESPYAHRERSFLDNPRTPSLARSTLRVRLCARAPDGRRGGGSLAEGCTPAAHEVAIPAAPSLGELRALLGPLKAKLLVLDDARLAFGSFGAGPAADAAGGARAGTAAADAAAEALARTYHNDAQALLSSWCCTSDPRYKRLAGVVPYLLPPLEGQSVWRGKKWLDWASNAMADIFEAAGDKVRAAEVRPCVRSKARKGSRCAPNTGRHEQ